MTAAVHGLNPQPEPDIYIHTGPTPSASSSPPWTILGTIAALMVSVASGAYLIGGLSKSVSAMEGYHVETLGPRVTTLETRITDVTKELRDAVERSRKTDEGLTGVLAEVKTQNALLAQQLVILIRQNEAKGGVGR